ncbi:mannose-6-phosphate isomeras-like protein [Patellaria atrata CBS 101060]|uniref:Mannose-6-phosphate isomerase n=1 Tax=Patellaria atrata CBS 101060 TaxID=1346257 RepID=A0A9P4VS74_9PEZI|nr:mannose-6-phosphate isomeras-like protein [Patellaria atrata CBS 101060]
MVEKVLQLKCGCNQYSWGRQGSGSAAARLCSKTPGTDFKIEEDKPYAELWMGTYPELPSRVLSTGEDLQDVLDRHSDELIGQNVIKKFGHTMLPFLPKVLSIAKALPLQLHPNKELASKLHEEDPSNFTDPNHKPEIALALTPFEAFVGFKPLAQIEPIFELESLKQFVPSDSSPFTDATLKKIVHTILSADGSTIADVQSALKSTPANSFKETDSYIPAMVARLQNQYDETDPGTLVALLTMNYMRLSAGEALYIPADGIHAYLSGDIIECMARSNNVLNTGFCPASDRNNVDTFISVLTFKPHNAQEALLGSTPFEKAKNGKARIYKPPLSEFNMLSITLGENETEEVQALGGPGILVVTDGKGEFEADGKTHDLEEGFVYFIGQGVETKFSSKEKLKTFLAFVE